MPVCAHDGRDSDADRQIIQVASIVGRFRPLQPPRWRAGLPEGLIFVYGTRGSEEDRGTSLAVARYCQQLLWYRAYACPSLVSDEQYLAMLNSPGCGNGPEAAIFFGDARSNGASPITQDRAVSAEPGVLYLEAGLDAVRRAVDRLAQDTT